MKNVGGKPAPIIVTGALLSGMAVVEGRAIPHRTVAVRRALEAELRNCGLNRNLRHGNGRCLRLG